MYFVVMPDRSHSEHLGMYCIVMPSIFVNCPAVICLPNIASYLRETPLVICGPWSYLLHTVYNTCCNPLFTVPCNSYCFPHIAFNSLFCKAGEIDNLSDRGSSDVLPAPCRRGNHHRRLHHHACLRSDA